MSRHRDIRNMDCSEDYDGYDDVYGRSVDDDICISPSRGQFVYNRDSSGQSKNDISMEEDIQEEDEAEEEIKLSDEDKIKLESCMNHVKSVFAPLTTPRSEIVKVIIANKFDTDQVINALLKLPPKAEKRDKAIAMKPAKGVVPSTANIIKAFEIEPLSTSRSQSPSSGRGTPVITQNQDTDELKSTKKDEKTTEDLYKKERAGIKEQLHMIVIGHVDAGKSTLMGRLLYDLGHVNQKTMHKYEQESKKLGKQSFMYAWVLDETGDERERGVTMDCGRRQFETKNKKVALLDAPGHKDFIPNMISGASLADVALLVVDATRGEFETGFDYGGQTREHALLVGSLGVTQLAVVVNKLDTVSWSQDRFEEITEKIKSFLKQAGFKESDVSYVPCSGLTGENLIGRPTEDNLLAWYKGPCLLEVIDGFRPPARPVCKPFRLSVYDIFKGTGSALCISGRVETGSLSVGDKVLICPNKESGVVKSLAIEEASQSIVFAGDHATVTLSGVDMQIVRVGNILCDPTYPVQIAKKFEVRIVVFNIEKPIVLGCNLMLHHQCLQEPGYIVKFIAQLDKSTGELIKKRPRLLPKNSSAMIEFQVYRPIALELYKDCKELGRVMLRRNGVTVAAGLITNILE